MNPESDNTSGPKVRLKRWWLPVVILLVAGAAAAALIASKAKPKPVAVAERAWLVSTTKASASRYAPSLTLYGRIESLWSSELTAGVAADVLEVPVVEGELVAKDTILVRLDDRDERLELAQREAELKQAVARIETEKTRHQANLEALPREKSLLNLTRSEVIRLQDLVKKKVGAQSALDTSRQALDRQAISLSLRQQAVDDHSARMAEVEAARERAEALRDQARLELERCEVRAPYNGRIARVLVSPGRRARVGDPLLSMYDTDELLVRAQLPSRHMPAIRAAMSAGEPLIAVGSIDGIPIRAQLRSLAGEAASGTGGVDGLFRVIEGGEQVNQGRFVRLELALPAQDGLIALPHESIYGNDRIYLIDGQSRMRARQVERVGETRLEDGRVQVLVRAPKLSAGTRVVTTQLPNALDGLLVRETDTADVE